MKLARVALVSDLKEEQWHSMDLVSELLLMGFRDPSLRIVEATQLCPRMVRRATRIPVLGRSRVVATGDRVVNRFWDYPRWLRNHIADFDLFHIVDHSYAHLALELPRERTLIMCHDIDAFEAALPGAQSPSRIGAAIARRLIEGMQVAARVVCGTEATRDALIGHGIVPPSRVSVVPYGLDPTCSPRPDALADREAAALLGPIQLRAPEILHVGSVVPRKRIDVLLDVFAAVGAHHPEARLVRVGGQLTGSQQRQAERLGIADRIVTLPFIDRRVLCAVYRRAALVLQPSEREGFGLPVAEAMACGTPVVASDVPALREAGGAAGVYCDVGDVGAWRDAVCALLNERASLAAVWSGRRAAALANARRFDVLAHARGIIGIYRDMRPQAIPEDARVLVSAR